MGMYTQLHYNARLKEDTPKEVLNILKFMTVHRDQPTDDREVPDHELFQTQRWPYILTMGSAYFAAEPHSRLIEEDYGDWRAIRLNVNSNIKNYDNEIEKFVDWIDEYVDAPPGVWLGYKRYEEDNEPTLIYKKGEDKPKDCIHRKESTSMYL